MAEVVQSDVFQSTFEQCGIGLAHVSPAGDFIRVNKALSSFLGYSQEELVKLDFQDITHPDFLDNDLQHVSELIDGFYGDSRNDKQRLDESLLPTHYAISLSGEPTMYPKLPELIKYLKSLKATKSILVET